MLHPKDLVLAFYESDSWKNIDTLKQFCHDDYQQYWHTPEGFIEFDLAGVIARAEVLAKRFSKLDFKISHVIEEKDQVVLRYTFYGAPIDNPDLLEEQGHYIAIWQVRDGELYRCYEVNAPADTSPESLHSFER